MSLRSIALLLIALPLAACSSAPISVPAEQGPGTTLTAQVAAASPPSITEVAAASAGRLTGQPKQEAAAQPTASVTTGPTDARTLTPTATDQPSVTPTATARPTSQPTVTSTVRPRLASTITPTATPPVAALLASGRWRQLIGDCNTARRELAELLSKKLSPLEASEARFRMAQCYLRDDAPDEALATLSELLTAAAKTDPYRAPATFLLGETLTGLGRWRDAEAAYRAYLPVAPELAYLTWQRIGATRRALGDLPGAVAAYQSALKTSPDWTNTVAIRRALADLALQQNSPGEAVAQYDILRGKETTGKWAAEMQYLAGTALAKGALAAILPGPTLAAQLTPGATPTVGLTATPSSDLVQAVVDAQARWRAAVEADVTSPYAHSAIVALLDSGAVVDEYQRGLANYHKGNYELAIAAFDRLLSRRAGWAGWRCPVLHRAELSGAGPNRPRQRGARCFCCEAPQQPTVGGRVDGEGTRAGKGRP